MLVSGTMEKGLRPGWPHNFTERRIPQDRGSKEKDCARLARKGQLHGMENTTARMSGKKGKMERSSSRSVAKEKLKDGLCYIMDV